MSEHPGKLTYPPVPTVAELVALLGGSFAPIPAFNAIGNSGASKLIDWSGSKLIQSITISEATALTFTAPSSPGTTILIMTNGGAFAITWPTILWQGGVEPSWTVAGVDVVTFVYDGTNYYGAVSIDHS